jgi:pimeloyl-ACP methyl ester carboxylesterase
MRRGRSIALGCALLVASTWGVVRFWPAPSDRGPTRPVSVTATAYPQRDVEIDGVRLRFIDQGPRDGEVLILLPGHTSRIEELEPLVSRLSGTFRVLVFDFPGSGYSDKPDSEYRVADYEDWLIAFMDALGIERAHLAGGSLGANVLLGAAARYPERFVRLAPWSPGSAWPARPRLAQAGRLLVAGYLPFRLSVAIQSTYWYRPDFPGRDAALRETFRYYDEVMGPGFVRMYWGLALDTLARSLFDIAPHVPHPTQISVGALDTTPYMQIGVPRLHELLPHSELVVYPHAPHSIASEQPERLADAVTEFLTRPETALP